uniref:Uncharacterized protein TCIL3000_5_4550 n=1 Tax=Trypanosoma congolense (strain IL3000) TaxID=1068625 RepID=G0UM44_TRYCI|nr:unnamed protein product [Trypanosoma congolense IL3000]
MMGSPSKTFSKRDALNESPRGGAQRARAGQQRTERRKHGHRPPQTFRPNPLPAHVEETFIKRFDGSGKVTLLCGGFAATGTTLQIHVHAPQLHRRNWTPSRDAVSCAPPSANPLALARIRLPNRTYSRGEPSVRPCLWLRAPPGQPDEQHRLPRWCAAAAASPGSEGSVLRAEGVAN